MFLELNTPLGSLQEWQELRSGTPQIRDKSYIESIVASVKIGGLVDPLLGYIPASQVKITPPNYRESLTHRLNSRQRAITSLVAKRLLLHGPETKIYAPEAVSPLASLLGSFADFQGSEYLPTEFEQARFAGILHQDVMNLTLPDGFCDVYVACEIMEHVPDMALTLREARRVIKPGGEFLATFPFAVGSKTNRIKSRLERDGTIVHLMPPEYHGNPVDSKKGSLVFTVPGWEILDIARAAGFKTATMIAIASRVHGIVATDIAAVFVMRATV